MSTNSPGDDEITALALDFLAREETIVKALTKRERETAKRRELGLCIPPGTLIDESDRARVSTRSWSMSFDGYVACFYRPDPAQRNKKRTLRLHRFILDAKPGEIVDHINGNKLDNQRANLRIVSTAINIQNRHVPHGQNKSGYRGVSWDARSNRWRATCTVFGSYRHLGYFHDLTFAAALASAYRAVNMPGSTRD